MQPMWYLRPVQPRTGLRERKKAQTRAALSLAAMRLATERGVDGVTTDEIADAANVSVRTFHNYFVSKEEAIVAPYRALVAVAVDVLHSRPPEEPILRSLEDVAVGLVGGAIALPDEAAVTAEQLWLSPRMASYRPVLVVELIGLLVGPVARRTRTDPEADLYPRLVAAVAAAAILTVFESRPGRDGGPEGRVRLVRDAFALLRAGFPEPEATTVDHPPRAP